MTQLSLDTEAAAAILEASEPAKEPEVTGLPPLDLSPDPNPTEDPAEDPGEVEHIEVEHIETGAALEDVDPKVLSKARAKAKAKATKERKAHAAALKAGELEVIALQARAERLEATIKAVNAANTLGLSEEHRALLAKLSGAPTLEEADPLQVSTNYAALKEAGVFSIPAPHSPGPKNTTRASEPELPRDNPGSLASARKSANKALRRSKKR
jgi:hypothetical protein